MVAAVPTAVEATTISFPVEAAAAEAATAVKAAPTPASVKAAAATAAAVTSAAMLGKDRLRRANEGKRNKSCEKNLQQGGFAHFSSSMQKRLAGSEGTPLLLNILFQLES